MPIASEILCGGTCCPGDGVAHPRLPHILDTGDQISHLTHTESVGLLRFWRDHPHLEKVVFGFGGHHENAFAVAEFTVDHADVSDHTAVGVVDGIEDQGPRSPSGLPNRGGNLGDDLVQQLSDTDTGFR